MSGSALANDQSRQKDGFWYLQTSVYTKHYSKDTEHDDTQQLIGAERNEASGLVWGAATFENSFSQRSYYGYVGERFDSPNYPVYFKLTGGLLKGYRGEYKDKIPLNHYGIAPVLIPALGAHYGPVAAEVVFLGFNAYMITAGIRI
ncbi:sn-glycerol-3-phosphate transporter [Pseudomonas sp. ITA]|nr:sn-glycerol-3-phosphate transporter [Pseudomonas sp. ITA]